MKLKSLSAIALCLTTVGLSATPAHDGWRSYEHGWGDGYSGGREHGWREGYERGHRDRDLRHREAREERRYWRDRCKKKGGTTGLLIGGVAGGLLGREIAKDDTLGAIVGGGIGALAGRAIERGKPRC